MSVRRWMVGLGLVMVVRAGYAETIGVPDSGLVSRGNVDGNQGSLYVYTGDFATTQGPSFAKVTGFNIYANIITNSGRTCTPVVCMFDPQQTYTHSNYYVVGYGQSVTVAITNVVQSFAYTPVWGLSHVGYGYTVGWKDGTPSGGTKGDIEYGGAVTSNRYLAGKAVNVSLLQGAELLDGSNYGTRVYSINFTSTPDPAMRQTPHPIGLTGFNRDMVMEVATGHIAYAFDNIGVSAGFGLYEEGYTNTAPAGSGLPSSGWITSKVINAVTDGHTVFKLAPYNANNGLRLAVSKDPATNTLTFAVPAAYKSLAILAGSGGSSGGGTGSIGTLVINFQDGTVATNSLFGMDWGLCGNVFPTGTVGRLSLSTSDPATSGTYSSRGFGLWETDVDLTPSKNYLKTINSITFIKAARPTCTTILAISGEPWVQAGTELFVK